MKVSKEQLKALIKEELDAVMKEEETYTPRKDPAVQKMAGDAVRDEKALKGIEKHERDQIKKAKGQKDRISVLSEKVVDGLKSLVFGKAKNDYVFTNDSDASVAGAPTLINFFAF